MVAYHFIGALTEQDVPVYAAYVYDIVGNEPVPAVNEFQRRFAFADARISENDDADAVYFNQNTVNTFSRSENIGKQSKQTARKIGRFQIGLQNGAAGFIGKVYKSLGRNKAMRKNTAGNFV